MHIIVFYYIERLQPVSRRDYLVAIAGQINADC